MATKNNIRLVVERLFTMAAGGPVNTSEKASKYPNVIKKIEETYDVRIASNELTVGQIIDICYNTNRAKAIAKIKRYIGEYNIDMSEVFSNDEGASIH